MPGHASAANGSRAGVAEKVAVTPTTRARISVAIGIALLSAALFFGERLREPGSHSDFGQAWFGARALFHGTNPYSLIGPGLQFDWPWPMFYPGTTLIISMPFVILPELYAATVFVAVSAGLLAFAVTKDGWYRLPLFLSSAFVIAVRAAQWSPLMTAALCIPALAWVIAAKPNFGIVLVAFSRSSKAVMIALAGCVLLAGLSLVLLPSWPADWISNIGSAHQFTIPLGRWGGALVLLALLRWRRPEARLLVAIACIPQTAYWYEALPLLLIPATFRESLTLSLLSALGFLMERYLVENQPNVAFHDVGTLMVVFLYLPATIMVLRRPNTGEPPEWASFMSGRRRSAAEAVPRDGSMV